MNGNTPIVALFLTEDEVAYLTGIGRGADGKSKHDMQCTQLKLMAVPFRVNARGMPIVTHAAVEGSKPNSVESKPVWKSNKG